MGDAAPSSPPRRFAASLWWGACWGGWGRLRRWLPLGEISDPSNSGPSTSGTERAPHAPSPRPPGPSQPPPAATGPSCVRNGLCEQGGTGRAPRERRMLAAVGASGSVPPPAPTAEPGTRCKALGSAPGSAPGNAAAAAPLRAGPGGLCPVRPGAPSGCRASRTAPLPGTPGAVPPRRNGVRARCVPCSPAAPVRPSAPRSLSTPRSFRAPRCLRAPRSSRLASRPCAPLLYRPARAPRSLRAPRGRAHPC